MSIFNPWGEVRELKAELANAERMYQKLDAHIKKLEFANNENVREIKVLEAALAEARKNDTRDSTGRFTKAKK